MGTPEDSLVAPARGSPIKLVLATVTVVAIATAAWWTFGRGKGQPEDPARVLIIGPTPELAEWLEREGFDVDHLSFGAAVGEGQAFDAGLDDLPAILEYADQTGIGYIALSMAHGERYQLAASDYPADDPDDPDDPPDGTTFAVVSVGDLGRHLSYGGVAPGVVHEHPIDERIGLLLALFGQPELAKARSNQARNDLMIRFGSARTLAHVIELEKAQESMRREAAAWTALTEKERGDPRPIELARPMEGLRGWPLANGAILLASARGAWRSDDGLDSYWHADDTVAALSVVVPEHLDQREPCPTLPDSLPFEPGAWFGERFAIAPAGDALLLPINPQVAELWVLTDDGCGFERRDEIRRFEGGRLGLPRASGRTASSYDGHLHWADARQRNHRSASIGGVTLRPGTLSWLGDDLLASPANLDFVAALDTGLPEPAPAEPIELPTPRDAVVFVRLPSGPDAELTLALIPVDALVVGDASQVHLRAVFPITAPTPTIAAYVDAPDGLQLIRASLEPEGPAWRTRSAVDEDLSVAVEAGRAAVRTELLARELPLDAHDLTVSPTGTHAAWAQPVGDTQTDSLHDSLEIFVLALASAGAEPVRMTDNRRRDGQPIFAGREGRLLLFTSGYRLTDFVDEIESLRALPIR